MTTFRKNCIIPSIAILFILAVAGNGFANRPGYKPGGLDPSRGIHGMTAADDCNDHFSVVSSRLSPEEANRLDAARDRFLDETLGLRREITVREQAMRSELNSEDPSSSKLFRLQDELSGLRTQWDKQRLQHCMEVQAIVSAGGAEKSAGLGSGPNRIIPRS